MSQTPKTFPTNGYHYRAGGYLPYLSVSSNIMVSSRRDLIPLRQSGQRPKTCPLSGGAPKNAIFFFFFMGTKSFKENVLDSILTGAKSYQSLLGFDFVVKSDAFRFRSEYVIRFHADNFLHLTGVGTSLSPKEFFFKAVDGSLSLDDFDCEATPQRKGMVRLKVRNIRNIGAFFDRTLAVQEKLVSGRVICLFAATDGTFTLGFTGGKMVNPMSLLNKNKNDPALAILDFVIEKKRR